jgi:hypothetical protein
VTLLVQVPKRDRVSKQLIEVLDTLLALGFVERNRQSCQLSERLRLMAALVRYGPGVLQGIVNFRSGRHKHVLTFRRCP